MKKTFFALALAFTGWGTAQAESITLGTTEYAVERIEDREVAPGVQYVKLRIPKKGTYGANVYVTIADLSNENIRAEVIQANDRFNSVETLASMAKRKSAKGHTVVAGANGNFWITSETPWNSWMKTQAWGTTVCNGEMICEPNDGTSGLAHCGGPMRTGAIVISTEGKAYINKLSFIYSITNTTQNLSVNANTCNRIVFDGELGIYNKWYPADKQFQPIYRGDAFAPATWNLVDGKCTEVLCDLAEGETLRTGVDVKYVVKEVRKNAGRGTRGKYDLAIVAQNSTVSFPCTTISEFKVGDEIIVKTRYNFRSAGTPEVAQAISGNVLAMSKGTINNDLLGEETYNVQNYGRTLYATNDDGTKLGIFVAENKSGKITGLSTREMCNIAQYFGFTYASQTDCGGSSQMYVDGSQVSVSTDASNIRSVFNGLFIVCTDENYNGNAHISTELKDYDFGEIESGQTTKKDFAITSTYLTENINVEVSGDTDDFTVSPTSISPNTASSITVVFAPKSIGNKEITVTLTTAGVKPQSYVIRGTSLRPSLDNTLYPDYALANDILASDSYQFEKVYDLQIEELAGKSVKRVLAHLGHLIILAHDAAKKPTVIVYDHVAGKTVRTLSTNYGVGTVTISDIALTTDQYLLAINEGAQAFNGAGAVMLYKWGKDEADGLPTGEAIQWNTCNLGGNYNNSVTGESFLYTGSADNGKATYTARTATGSGIRMVSLDITNGLISGNVYDLLNTVSGYGMSNFGEVLLWPSPLSDADYMIQSTLKTPVEFEAVSATRDTPKLVDTFSLEGTTPSRHNGMMKFGGRTYMSLPILADGMITGFTLADITAGMSKAQMVTVGGATMGTEAAGASATAMTSQVEGEGENVTDVRMAVFVAHGDGKIAKFLSSVKTTGIDDLTDTPEAEAPAEYFDLQGRPVVNPEPGVYIMRRGTEVRKVVIR